VVKTPEYSRPVQIELGDTLGNIVATIWQGEIGLYSTELVSLSTRQLTSGMFFVRMRAGGNWETKQIAVIK